MRIALIGQAAFAEKALETLHARGEEIVHVFAPPDPPSGRPDPLKRKAIELGLALSQPKSFKSDEAYQHFVSLNADLAVLAFVTIIVPERVLYAPRFKSICFHPSLLPRRRGASALNWAIIDGDRETGVSWFWPDQGIDTGPLLIQRTVAIGPDDTTGSLYFDKIFPLGIATLGEAIDLIKHGDPPAIAQDESRATYEQPCRAEQARIDFSKPADVVYNLVRGCDPQPGANAELSGRRLTLYDASLNPEAPAETAGTIVGIDGAGMRIALAGGTLTVRRVRLADSGKKLAPADLVAEGLTIRAKLT
ncbi:MAG: methionyl-tRNA formyltransferase [Candidatus Binataceae bacterium]|nr:methionyl-tRNA formyltransferase [Candidatus Binataceae bacterium]